MFNKFYRLTALLLTLATLATLQACAPLLVGGAMMGGTLVASDRRTVGAQTEDQGIEFKALSALPDALNRRGNISATSYNRQVLLTGEVASEADKKLAETTVSAITNVRGVVNELTVQGAASIASRGNDSFITGKIKASFVDAKDVFANSFKVVTERGVVYLMGIVTEREATRGAEIASRVPGVQRVVKVFESVTEDELKRMTLDPTNSPPAKPQRTNE
jgi:osmotically-inducible protein OsmY